MANTNATGRIPTTTPPTTIKKDGTVVKPNPLPAGVQMGLTLNRKPPRAKMKASSKGSYGSRPPRGL